MKPLLKQITTYCLKDSGSFVYKRINEYNSQRNLIKTDQITNKEGLIGSTQFYYTDSGLIDYEKFYRTNFKDSMILSHTTEYKYDWKNCLIGKRIIHDDYEEWRPNELNDTIITFTKNRIIKQSKYVEQYFDRKGKLLKEIGNDRRITKYKYTNNELSSKSHYLFNRLRSRVLYFYDSGNLVKTYTEYYDFYHFHLKPKKFGNFESREYCYQNELLIEERTIDRGFDPCCQACCGDFLIKYEYEK